MSVYFGFGSNMVYGKSWCKSKDGFNLILFWSNFKTAKFFGKKIKAIFFSQKILKLKILIQARIAQLVAYRLGTGEVPGSNPGKGENFSVKISNWIVRI